MAWKYNAQPPKYNACLFSQTVKIEVEDFCLFLNKLSVYASSIGIEKTSMHKNKMLAFSNNGNTRNMSEELNQIISFWGGAASIVALFASIIGGFLVFLKNLRRKHKLELEKLQKIRDQFAERAKAATTQGKRMDLFSYHQMLISSMQSSQISDDIWRMGYFVSSLMFFFFFASLDDSANYLIDRITGKSEWFYGNYEFFLVFIIALIFISNLQLMSESKKHKKLISAITGGLLDQLGEIIDPTKANKTNQQGPVAGTR